MEPLGKSEGLSTEWKISEQKERKKEICEPTEGGIQGDRESD